MPGQASTRALFPTEKFYHKDCFLCTSCNLGIAESEFIDVDNKQYVLSRLSLSLSLSLLIMPLKVP